MAPVFAEGKTIPSAHIVLFQVSCLKLENGQKIEEIGTGTSYNATIVAETAGENSIVYSTEIRPNVLKIGRENTKKNKLEDRIIILEATKGILGSPENAPYDRIYSLVGAHTTIQVEQLIDQLAINGILRLAITKYGYKENKNKAKLWEPGIDVGFDDMYFTCHIRRFTRNATYTFRKDNKNNITYSITNPRTTGPLLEE